MQDLSKASRDTLFAIKRFRHQRRTSGGWVIGDRRISANTVVKLQRKSLIKEVAVRGTPMLMLMLTPAANAILDGALAGPE